MLGQRGVERYRDGGATKAHPYFRRQFAAKSMQEWNFAAPHRIPSSPPSLRHRNCVSSADLTNIVFRRQRKS
jgi:hypothetical protein